MYKYLEINNMYCKYIFPFYCLP